MEEYAEYARMIMKIEEKITEPQKPPKQ
jgi:hypothetical protein